MLNTWIMPRPLTRNKGLHLSPSCVRLRGRLLRFVYWFNLGCITGVTKANQPPGALICVVINPGR